MAPPSPTGYVLACAAPEKLKRHQARRGRSRWRRSKQMPDLNRSETDMGLQCIEASGRLPRHDNHKYRETHITWLRDPSLWCFVLLQIASVPTYYTPSAVVSSTRPSVPPHKIYSPFFLKLRSDERHNRFPLHDHTRRLLSARQRQQKGDHRPRNADQCQCHKTKKSVVPPSTRKSKEVLNPGFFAIGTRSCRLPNKKKKSKTAEAGRSQQGSSRRIFVR